MNHKKKRGGNVLIRSGSLFVHSNRLVEAHYKESLSHLEMFIFSKMCTMIAPEDTDFKLYTIYVKDILEHLNVQKGGHNYKYIVEAAQRLLDRKITIYYVNDNDEKIAIDTHLVSSIHRIDTENSVSYSNSPYIALTFPPELRPALLQLKNNFTILDLDIFTILKTPTSVRLYQLLVSHLWKAEKKVEYDLEDLKKKLGVAEKYEQYGPFKNYVLNEAQNKLSENTNLSFTYTEVKTGKKITSLIFYLHEKSTKKESAPQQLLPVAATTVVNLETTEVQEKLMTELFPLVVGQYGVGLKIFTQLVTAHTEGEIREAIKVTEKTRLKGKVDNLAGFFVKAVQEHYKAEPTKEEREETTNQKQILVKQRADAQQERDNQNRTNEAKKEAFRQEEQYILKLILSDNTLEEEATDYIQTSGLSTIYDPKKALSENLQNPSIKAAFHLAVKKLRPNAF